MPQITESIRPELARLLPSSLLMEVACFVFYDNHPRDQKHIDIIVATVNGEIKEFFKRSLGNSINIESRYPPTDIKIIRNGNCDLFYLVAGGDELTIISRKEKPVVHRRVENVEKYSVEDAVCRGQGGLKVIIKDDAVPLVFDDNFVSLGDKAFVLNGLRADDSLPILTELMRKLTETKYSVKCNEGTLKKFMSLRQTSALASYQKIHPNTEESIFKTNSSKEDEVLRVKCLKPWVRMCNKKVVIVLVVSYTNSTVPVEDIHILLHGTNRPTMVYTTKLFEKTKIAPFWEEKRNQSLLNNHDVAIVSVVDLDEIAMNYLSRIEFNGVISYKRLDKEYVMPFEHVVMTSMDTMAEKFNALAHIDINDEMLSLAVVATTIKTELRLRHMRVPDEPPLEIPDAFCNHLNMSRIENTDRAVVYRQSPYHVINGVMLVFAEELVTDDCYKIFIYASSPAQVVSLMHYINDGMPQKIIITTPHLKVSHKSEKPPRYGVEPPKTMARVNYDYYASSLLNQSNVLLEYLDKCMGKMGESKDMEMRSKIGSEIDIVAAGLSDYMDFRTKMLDEALKGVKSIQTDDVAAVKKTEVNMMMD